MQTDEFCVSCWQGEFISMGVYAAGNSYGVPDDLIYSFPIQIKVSPTYRRNTRANSPDVCRCYISPQCVEADLTWLFWSQNRTEVPIISK